MIKTKKCIEFKGRKLKNFFEALGHFKRSNQFNKDEMIRKVYVMGNKRAIVQTIGRNVYFGKINKNTLQIGEQKIKVAI